MKNLFCISLFFLSAVALKAQDIKFAAGSPLFHLLLADPKEPRIAVLNYNTGNGVELDIGSSLDLVEIDFKNPTNRKLALGADFGTFTVLNKRADFRFPVDAEDFIFGLNLSYAESVSVLKNIPTTFSARLRMSHISAHFVDGHYDYTTDTWYDNLQPFIFSREFFNLVMALEAENVRVYAGYEFLYHVLPDGVPRNSVQAGVEGSYPIMSWLVGFAGYDLKFVKQANALYNEFGSYIGCNDLQVGVKLNSIRGRGLRFVLNYYNGLDTHGMYYARRVELSTLGIVIDF
jgi:hypothetical protein